VSPFPFSMMSAPKIFLFPPGSNSFPPNKASINLTPSDRNNSLPPHPRLRSLTPPFGVNVFLSPGEIIFLSLDLRQKFSFFHPSDPLLPSKDLEIFFSGSLLLEQDVPSSYPQIAMVQTLFSTQEIGKKAFFPPPIARIRIATFPRRSLVTAFFPP